MMTTTRKIRKTPPSQVLRVARAQSTAVTTAVTVVTLISIWIIWCARWMTAMMTSPQRSLLKAHKRN